jgi:SecD/SecF fusion protein
MLDMRTPIRFFILALMLVFGTGLFGCARPDLKRNGGTRLVYEVGDEIGAESYGIDDLAAAVKRRLDPAGTENILVRPVGQNRLEVSVPRRPNHEARVQQVKELLATTGVLEFCIVANAIDDSAGIEAAKKYFAAARTDSKGKGELDRLATSGAPPSPLRPAKGESWPNGYTYSWFELGRDGRAALKLNNSASEDPDPDSLWKKAAEARRNGDICMVSDQYCLFSRDCQNRMLPEQEREQKKYEYFVLCRDPEKHAKTGRPMRITANYMERAFAATNAGGQPAVGFHFGRQGGDWFHELTSKNQPVQTGDVTFRRRLAIILDGQIRATPSLNALIGQDGIIDGNFTQKEVDRLVTILRAGALPAQLKPVPVIEEDVKPEKQ